MTAPTYPRVDHSWDARIVWINKTTAFECATAGNATLALRALNDAFAAGQRSMIKAHGDRLERAIEALKPAVERKDDDRTDA